MTRGARNYLGFEPVTARAETAASSRERRKAGSRCSMVCISSRRIPARRKAGGSDRQQRWSDDDEVVRAARALCASSRWY